MRCHNSEKYYNGKENTPLGRGYSASGFKENHQMKGKDGRYYRVQVTKKGKRWTKKVSKNISPRGFLMSSYGKENSQSDYYYRYSRYTIYVDRKPSGRLDILYVKKGPTGKKISLDDIEPEIKTRMINDLGKKIKKGKMTKEMKMLREKMLRSV
jgi:hypothetical protein